MQPSLTGESWTEEDARLFHILTELGTNSPEGQELVTSLKAQYGDGWVAEWGRMQDYLVAKYKAATSDESRLTTLQTTTTQQAAAMDPTQQFLPTGSVPYSIHDINAFRAMTPQQQADFITGFTDPAAAAYFMMVAGVSEEALWLIPPEYGGNKGAYIGPDGKEYTNIDEWNKAWQQAGGLPGQVTSVTTSTGEVITDPERLSNLSHEEVFGTPSSGGYQPPPTFTAPSGPFVPSEPTPGFVIPGATDEGQVPVTTLPVPVLPGGVSPGLIPSGATGGGGGGGSVQLSPEDEVMPPDSGMSKFILPALVVGGLLLFSKRGR